MAMVPQKSVEVEYVELSMGFTRVSFVQRKVYEMLSLYRQNGRISCG